MLRVSLARNGEQNVLTPLGVSDFAELTAGAFENSPRLVFEIELDKPVDRMTITISNGSGLAFKQEMPTSLHVPGLHRWAWDGFNQLDILDTQQLRDKLTVSVRTEKNGQSEEARTLIVGEREGEKWSDAVVDRGKRSIEVKLRVHLKEGAVHGTGEAPPADAQSQPAFRALPPNDPRRQPHKRARTFLDLQRVALDGIRLYWSRTVSAKTGVYSVSVDPIPTRSDAMDDIAIAYNTNRAWMRSSNPGSVRGFYSLFGNFVPERVAYNVGWIRYGTGWVYRRPLEADREFSVTVAHELGHEILSAYGGDSYSYSHRGSSTVITQKTLPPSSGGLTYPSTGTIDLMKYYNGSRPTTYYSQISASEQDVRSLLWLARVRFRA